MDYDGDSDEDDDEKDKKEDSNKTEEDIIKTAEDNNKTDVCDKKRVNVINFCIKVTLRAFDDSC